MSTYHRLVPRMQESGLWGWLGPAFVALLGGVLRFLNLGHPRAVVFDETYYAKDAYALLRFGAERETLGDDKNPIADRMLIAGDLNIWERCPPAPDCASYVAHPPLGKWMIAVGEWIFGMNPYGWRVAAALAGTLMIFILARLARRMTRSTLLGCFAGLLLALDGLHFVMSRIALLDIFLAFWVLAGFACLVVDRDKARGRLAEWHERSAATLEGPWLGLRPWRLAAGACLGAACAVKWSGIFFLLAFALLSFLWDMGARRAVGLRKPYVGAINRDLPTALGAMALAPALVFMATWTGWFVTDKGWGRNWDQATSSGPLFFVFDSFRSWLGYQTQLLSWHSTLAQPHTYMSEPWQWPLLQRPISFYWQGKLDCGGQECVQHVLAVGTPALWFAAALAMLGMVAWYVAGRDWRAGSVVLAYAAGWAPWVYYALAHNRTMYFFYMVPLVPFMILALTLVAGLVLGRADASPLRRAVGAASVGAYALVVLINFWWLSPVLSGQTVLHSDWWARMLLRTWA
ncbi:phospholipid carrier-dependent glycosyltransferase [Nonomuraea sp. NPDC050310]|uniref:dolichyl-phosphate-mannose--protein mannosyltransferase n=1 Tax=Nonomuraea sp. NPDC050310 TaxID=3154935 RepID=UPI0033E4282B